MTAAQSADQDLIGEWLHHLYGHVEDGWLTIFSVNPDDGSRRTDWAPVYQLDAAADMARQRAATSNVWFGVATRSERLPAGRRGGDKDCAAVPALWLDIDIAGEGHQTNEPLPTDVADSLRLLDDFPLPPTAVVHSGHGLQAWWLLNEAATAEEAAIILPRWGHTWDGYSQARGWHLDNVFDVARIMRLPGTWNRKTDPRLVHHLEERPPQWTRRYGLGELDEWLADPPPPPERETGTRIPYIGPDRPGDAFNAIHTGADVLEMLHFHTPRRKPGGDVDYVRPGKDARKGASATVYGDDGHVTIWSETCRAEWPHLKIRQPYRPFGLLIDTVYRGDAAAAATALREQGYGSDSTINTSWLSEETAASVHLPEGTDEERDGDEDGWEPVDWATILEDGYEPPKPTVLRRSDGAFLLYEGRVNGFFGESGSGKSWMALLTCAQKLKAGETVLYVDLEDHASSIASRLTALGVTRDQIIDGFIYLSPSVSFGDRQAAKVDQLLDETVIAVAVVDSTGEAMALDGAKPNDDDDTARWIRRLPKRLARTGAAVVLIDHVPKDPENRGKPIGSQRKIAAVDGALYSVEVKVSPARGAQGRLVLKCAKDRNGAYARGALVGDVTVDSDATSGDVRISVKPFDANRKPTVLMERVSRFLELEGPASLATIRREVEGKGDYIKEAVAVLVEDGHLAQEVRAKRGGGSEFRVVRPYREPGQVGDTPEWVEDLSREPRPTAPRGENRAQSGESVTRSGHAVEAPMGWEADDMKDAESRSFGTAPNRAPTAPGRALSVIPSPPETAPRPLEGRGSGRGPLGTHSEAGTPEPVGARFEVPPPTPVAESSSLFGGPRGDDDKEDAAS